MSIAIYLFIVVVCLIGSAFFSSSETALFRLRSHDIEKEIETSRGPAGVAAAMECQKRQISYVLLEGSKLFNTIESFPHPIQSDY